MEKDLLLKLDRETLGQLATKQVVDITVEQAIASLLPSADRVQHRRQGVLL